MCAKGYGKGSTRANIMDPEGVQKFQEGYHKDSTSREGLTFGERVQVFG